MGVNFLNVGLPASILAAIGSGPEQRERADRLAQVEELRRYRAETLGLDRERLTETRRQSDLKYGPVTVNVPGVGEITAQREFIPALIQAASSREKDISPEEVTALTGYGERARLPAGGRLPVAGYAPGWDPAAEAEATHKAFPQFSKEVSPMTVDLPQVNVPRQSFEKIMTEAGEEKKAREIERKQNLQRLATAKYRELYSRERAKGTPHHIADAFAIDTATKEFGIAPEREAFVGEPRMEREPKITTGSFTNEAGDRIIYGLDDTGGVKFQRNLGRVHEQQQFNLGLYRTNLVKRSRNLPVTDPEIAAMTPQQAGDVLADLNRTDPIKQFLDDALKNATTPNTPGRAATRGEVEAAKRQAAGDPQRARQLLVNQGIDPSLPVSE